MKYTFAPEEMFIQTVVMNSPFAEKVRNSSLRHIMWTGGPSPKILTMADWAGILISDALFARKFDTELSSAFKENLNKYILHADRPEYNSHGCWLTDTIRGHCFDASLIKAIIRMPPFMEVKDIGDFGCGPCWYTWILRKCGYEANGYDGNPNVEQMSALLFNDGFYCQQADLTEEFEAETPFDMVMCLEVGEHIPSIFEDILFDNICRNARQYVLLSWAVPGQNGDGHVNCHTNEYVIKKMCERGFFHNVIISNYLRKSASLKWFHDTLMFFQRIDE